jgi:hypothetical protein
MLPQVDLRDRQALEDIFSSHRSLFLSFFLPQISQYSNCKTSLL